LRWPKADWDRVWANVDWDKVDDKIIEFRLKHQQFDEIEGERMKAKEVGLMAEKLELSKNHHKAKTGRLMLVAASLLMEVKMALMEEEAAEQFVEGLEKERIETK
jgi:hypothetical protein